MTIESVSSASSDFSSDIGKIKACWILKGQPVELCGQHLVPSKRKTKNETFSSVATTSISFGNLHIKTNMLLFMAVLGYFFCRSVQLTLWPGWRRWRTVLLLCPWWDGCSWAPSVVPRWWSSAAWSSGPCSSWTSASASGPSSRCCPWPSRPRCPWDAGSRSTDVGNRRTKISRTTALWMFIFSTLLSVLCLTA